MWLEREGSTDMAAWESSYGEESTRHSDLWGRDTLGREKKGKGSEL